LILQDLPLTELRRRLAGPGLRLRTGPVVSCIRSPLAAVASGVALHYAQHPVEDDDGFADFHVSVGPPRGLRRWVQRQVVFEFDGAQPFAPLPAGQGYPLLEWGLNWCVHSQCHQYLSIHSAVLEREGLALLLPAPSGSGKSTLCAALAFRGWRLLSDELAVVDPATGQVLALPRPISLKNDSIGIIGAYEPTALFSPAVADTSKGLVAHVRPPLAAVRRAGETAKPRWVVLPRYVAGAPATLKPLARAEAFMALVDNTFNYNVHGRAGFNTVAALIDGCECFEFSYSQLDDAVAAFDGLLREAHR
jgi:HprK-related kinase A